MEIRGVETIVRALDVEMKPTHPDITPDWKWGTAEGSRDLDRLLDRRLTFREKLEWLEEAETLSLFLQALRSHGEKPEK